MKKEYAIVETKTYTTSYIVVAESETEAIALIRKHKDEAKSNFGEEIGPVKCIGETGDTTFNWRLKSTCEPLFPDEEEGEQ